MAKALKSAKLAGERTAERNAEQRGASTEASEENLRRLTVTTNDTRVVMMKACSG